MLGVREHIKGEHLQVKMKHIHTNTHTYSALKQYKTGILCDPSTAVSYLSTNQNKSGMHACSLTTYTVLVLGK